MHFGDILRQLLTDRGLTQKQLGIDLNIAPTTIGNYIRGIREPDYNTLKIIAKYFNVSVDYLLDFRIDINSSHDEEQLVHIYRSLENAYKAILIKQALVLLDSQTAKKDE